MQFSVKSMLIWTMQFSIALGIAITLTASAYQCLAMVVVVSALCNSDCFSNTTSDQQISSCLRYSVYAARYSMAMAIATLICYGLYIINPERVKFFSDEGKPLPFGYKVIAICLTGQSIDFTMSHQWWIESKHFELIGTFSTLSFFFTLFSYTYIRSAKLLLMLGFLGICSSIYYFYSSIWLAGR